MDNLIELRNRMKKKKPKFIKQMGRQKKRLKNKWRKPRGSDSKIKVGKKGYPKKIKIGYKGPKQVRNLSRNGENIILIKKIEELKKIDTKKDIICLSKIGKRKKILIIKECIKLNLNILNLKDPSKFLTDFEKSLEKKKQEKKEKEQEKKEKESKTTKKKEGIEAKVDDKEENKKDKKEKDKVLTKREI